VPAGRRTARDERRARLGQNFLRPELADRFVESAGVTAGELVVEIGAGSGAITAALARRGAEVLAVELDPVWADRLRRSTGRASRDRVRIIAGDFLAVPLPRRPFRVVACVPFGRTTAILSRLLDDPERRMQRADVIVQWEVARKRSAVPASTLRSTAWAPWWEFRLGRRIPAADFRPVPRVDGGVLVVTRRDPPLLPPEMSARYQAFVRANWPFGAVATEVPHARQTAKRMRMRP
jgi:23S rRNA (adenine-N6)-dimethyltransferase